MRDYKGRNLADTASAVGSMLLFVLFAVCMLMAVAVAADTYGRIKTGYQQSFGTAASIKYISNKLRAAGGRLGCRDRKRRHGKRHLLRGRRALREEYSPGRGYLGGRRGAYLQRLIAGYYGA